MHEGASAVEVNFDCLVGPTHHFGGLSAGNLASKRFEAQVSNPKKAALQGLEKMRYLMKRGLVQGVLPPHERPFMKALASLGFRGSDEEILRKAHGAMPRIFSALCSSSFMWAANAATVCPSSDSADDLVHLSPSNLHTMYHRSIEAHFTHKVLKHIFADEAHFLVHDPLPAHDLFSDEGAANHSRLARDHKSRGLQIFVYGREGLQSESKTKAYPARQSKMANEALIRRHRLGDEQAINIEQNPKAIDAGAFHNDVVAVANENVLLCHELAFADQAISLSEIAQRYRRIAKEDPLILEVKDRDLAIGEAIDCYLFNSQLLTKPDGRMLLLAPADCQKSPKALIVIDDILNRSQVIDEVSYFDISESMMNGGGPACLRLRLALTSKELAAMKSSVILTDELFEGLRRIIECSYPNAFKLTDLFEREVLDGARQALDEISCALGLKGIYG